MGTQLVLLQQLSLFTTRQLSSLKLLQQNPYQKLSNTNNTSPSPAPPAGSSGGSYRSWKNPGPTSSSGRFRFNLQDDPNGYDDGYDEFGYGGTAKQRIWWSNDDDDDDDNDWDFDDVENEFWIFKVFRAFGWMLPAIAISLLLGTGPNAFIMALAVPLGQTALSLVIDKAWGNTSSAQKPRPRSKARKKPFARAATQTKTSERKEEEIKTGDERGSYQSWVATDNGAYKKGDKRVPKFGGWDELDRESHKADRGTHSQKADGLPKQCNKGKLSKARSLRDTPLLFRLLIAAFPFLASWTKFLF